MAKKPIQPRKIGRPPLYTPELAEEICRRIAEGESLRQICSGDDMPGRETVRTWILNDAGADPDKPGSGFSGQYARARVSSAESFEDRILANIADLEAPGTPMNRVQGLREASGLLLRLSAIRAPKTHGDLTKLEHTGGGGEPLQVVVNLSGEAGAG